MSDIIKKAALVSVIVMGLVGNTWGGWFTFEPNIVLLNGTAVGLEFKDIQKETAYKKTGETTKAVQLVQEEKVYIIKTGADQTRVEYISHKEYQGSIFVRVQDESGTKIWANMLGIACKGQDGKERSVTEQDLAKGKFEPLSKEML